MQILGGEVYSPAAGVKEMTEEMLEQRLTECGIPFSPDLPGKLLKYHELLLEWNAKMDLTAVTEEADMIDRHYVDSLMALTIPELIPQGASLIDVGTGAGFPGLPLALARADLRVTLMDAQQKRLNFLQAVLDALNVGMLMMNRSPEDAVEKAILTFVTHYGLLGLMTALPTTPSFMDYEKVYLPKNHFIKAESMETEDYLALFYPFDKLDVIKRGIESMWNIQNDRVMMALALTMTDKPMAVNMSFQREYAERYEWIKQQFIDWAFTYINSFLYYEDYDTLNDETRQMMQQSMAAFGGIAPTYHIALLDKPTIIWDFHSLMLGVQMMFSFMLTDSENPIKLCRHCTKAFVASRPSAVFCSPQCKNKHNVYKSRARNKSEE